VVVVGKKTPVNVSVKLGGKIRTQEQLIRRFIKKCKEEGIVKEVTDRRFFIPKGERRRRKKHAGKRRYQREQTKKSK
tara:strand:+ start:48078 stop:48308 length:231 start_codon:yes stop_codon:yes gene_type:complete